MRCSLLFVAVLALSLPPAAGAADYTERTTGMEFVRIPGGTFIMGDLYGTDPYAKPSHSVTVNRLLVAKYEVTFAQYDLFCEKTGRKKPESEGWGRDRRPVVNVSREDALAFASWLSEVSGKQARLLSEAEWEYAARGGKTTPYWWGSDIGRGNANCARCGSDWDGRSTAPVGSFAANPFGLYDMQGNVYEWVLDSWHPGYRGAPQDGSAWLDPHAAEFVSRGGSFNEVPTSLSAFARNWTGPNPARDIGFRLAIED